MVNFSRTMGGLEVIVVPVSSAAVTVGHIDKEGFHTSPARLDCCFVRISADDLRTIANRAEEFIRTKN